MQNIKLDNPLWRYAVERYQHKALETLLLQLQDEFAVNINMILTLAWISKEGYCLTSVHYAELEASLMELELDVVGPLRAVRRKTKAKVKSGLLDENIYLDVKTLELSAEKRVIAILYSVYLRQNLSKSVVGDSLLVDNISLHLSGKMAIDGPLVQKLLLLLKD